MNDLDLRTPGNARDEFDRALAAGVPAVPLRGRSVTVIVPDLTRPCPTDAVEAVVEHLREARLRILVGLGLHRPMTATELASLEAIAAPRGLELAQHDPDLVAPNASLHPWLLDADAVFAVGVVEPHQYAGYSGGTKALTIGCGSRAAIDRLHGLELLRDPTVRIGRREGNAFREALRRGASAAAPSWGLQMVRSSDGWRAWAGPLESTWGRAAQAAARASFRTTPQMDWMLLPVPPDKSASFYQALRAASYVALTERPAIRAGGWLIVEATCPEGLGRGSGERAFASALARGRSALARELHGEAPAPEPQGGTQRAYVLELTLARAKVGIAGAKPEPLLEKLGLRFFANRSEAIAAVRGTGSGTIWDDVFSTVPVADSSVHE